MRIVRIALVLAAAFSVQLSFADDQDMMSSSEGASCGTIAQACLSAGFTRADSVNKRFWADCMKPIVLGQTVTGVTVDANTVKQCRTSKIEELRKELQEFQAASMKKSS